MTRDGKGSGGSERDDRSDSEKRKESGKHAQWCDYPSGPCDCGADS